MEEKEERRWWNELGTLGELLLAYAVKRHGTNRWESIAQELRKRIKHSFSSNFCHQKYLELISRYNNLHLLSVADELRKLRVQELKQQLHRHNNSIAALQLKVKRLKQEETDPRDEPNKVFDSVENRSYNESNESTQNSKGNRDGGEEREEKEEITSQEDRTGLKREGSSRIKRRRMSRGDELLLEGGANKRVDAKSQPLIKLLDTLRSHKHGSPFITRLPSQETEKYQRLVRQHMDLDTIEDRFHNGHYNGCHSKFYRDLLLIFTNAVIFYRKSSAEHMAARELRKLVSDEIAVRTRKPNNNEAQPTKPNQEVQQLDPVVKKPRSSSTTSMVAYRRRSSGSMQVLSDSVLSKKKDDCSTLANNGSSDNSKVVTKGSCLSKRGGLKVISDNVKCSFSHVDKKEDEEKEKLVSETRMKKASMEHKEKGMMTRFNKQGVANFLKRIKQNSPSSQEEKKAKVAKKVTENGKEEEEEEEEDERRTKMRNDRNNKGKSIKGGNAANGDNERKVKKVTNKKMLNFSSPDSTKGGRRSLRSNGDETSTRSRTRSRR